MAGNVISPVPGNQPIADKQGLPSQIWVGFFTDLWNRAGGSSSSTNTQLQNQIDSITLSGANTIKGNNTGSPVTTLDLSPAQVNAMLPLFTSSLNGLVPLSGGGTSKFLRADASWQTIQIFDYFVSSQVTTTSSAITAATFTTSDNSPAFTFTPGFTGKYKIYCSIPLEITDASSAKAAARIVKTSGTGTLLSESQGLLAGVTSTVDLMSSVLAQSVYTLTAGVSYVFDIQAKVITGTSLKVNGTDANFYMFAERVS